jgi:hypothetical protein
VFRKPKPNLIESDSGFSVELVGGGKLIYREGGKSITFTTESSVGPVLFVVCLGEYSDCWDPPSDAVRISDEDWRRIADNIREAYRSQRLKIEVHVVPPEIREAARRRLSMCRKPKPNLIESDLGFSVEMIAWDKLVYREGGKELTLTAERLSGPAIFVVYLGEYPDCWDPPFEKVKISDEDFRRIGENIREAYQSQGSEIRFQLVSSEEREALKRGLEQLKRGESVDFREWLRRNGLES